MEKWRPRILRVLIDKESLRSGRTKQQYFLDQLRMTNCSRQPQWRPSSTSPIASLRKRIKRQKMVGQPTRLNIDILKSFLQGRTPKPLQSPGLESCRSRRFDHTRYWGEHFLWHRTNMIRSKRNVSMFRSWIVCQKRRHLSSLPLLDRQACVYDHKTSESSLIGA